MGFIITAACYCHIGKVRANNEDNFVFDGKCLEADNRGLKKPVVLRHNCDRQNLCVSVFDGMGGEAYGEEASFAAAQEMKKELRRLSDFVIPEKYFLTDCCSRMNDAVFTRAQELGTLYMGTTVAALLFTNREVYSCNLGDSKTFRLRNGEFLQLSKDHTDEDYLQAHSITNRKPYLTQHLGIDPEEFQLEPHIAKGELQNCDQYLICSDGLTDMLSRLEICNLMSEGKSANDSAERLVNAALKNGGKDNVTVIVIRVL